MEGPSSNPEATNTSELEINKPTIELNYILYNHDSMDLVPKVLDSLESADIILVEQFGGSDEKRQTDEVILNKLTHQGGILRDVDAIGEVFNGLAGSGKEMHYIDASSDEVEIYELTNRMRLESEKLNTMLYYVPFSQYQKQLLLVLKLSIGSGKLRNDLMQRQIDAVVQEQTKDTKIAILVGSMHSPISHNAPISNQLTVKNRQTWLQENKPNKPEIFHFNAYQDFERRLALTSYEEPTEDDVKQLVTAMYLERYPIYFPGKKAEVLPGDGAVTELLKQIDEICEDVSLSREDKGLHINALIHLSPLVKISDIKDKRYNTTLG